MLFRSLDFSTCVGKPQSQTLIDAAASVISRKVLFASANPFVNVTRAVEAFRALPFSPEVMERISVANGREFLGL